MIPVIAKGATHRVAASSADRRDRPMTSILDQVRAEVSKLTPEQVREKLAKLQERIAKQAEYHKTHRGAAMTPEQKAKRTEYNKKRLADPEVKAKMKAYREKPETKSKQTAYRRKRYAEQKALIARAKELGLIPADSDAETGAPPTEAGGTPDANPA
jgi:hypothetical protein